MPTTCVLALEFEGDGKIKGSCTIAGCEDLIQLLSWSQSFSQPATGAAESAFGSMTTSCATHSPLVITKYLDQSSGAILKACWKAAFVKQATITCYQASGADSIDKSNPYLKVEIKDGIITDYHINNAGDLPVEEFSFKYKEISYIFTGLNSETHAADSPQPISHNLAKGVVS